MAISGLLFVSMSSTAFAHGNWSEKKSNFEAKSDVLYQKMNEQKIQFAVNENSVNREDQSYNSQDQAYMNMIMMHHREAIAMADVELSRGSNEEVKEMARKIKMEQIDSLGKAENLYRSVFNAEPPQGMTTQLLSQLVNAQNVDKAFIELMIQHHLTGAQMDKEELAQGENEKVKKFAEEDIPMQFKDILKLRMLYKKIFAQHD